MTKEWCQGTGSEVELVSYPFQTVTCPLCGRAGLGAERTHHKELSRVMGFVPKHTARKIRPKDIPNTRFGDPNEEQNRATMQWYREYQEANKRK